MIQKLDVYPGSYYVLSGDVTNISKKTKYALFHADKHGDRLWKFKTGLELVEFLQDHQDILSYSDIDVERFIKKHL